MNAAVIGQETFTMGMVEVGSMIERSLFGGRSAEDFGAPGVAIEEVKSDMGKEKGVGDVYSETLQMAIKVDDRNRAVGAVYAAEER